MTYNVKFLNKWIITTNPLIFIEKSQSDFGPSRLEYLDCSFENTLLSSFTYTGRLLSEPSYKFLPAPIKKKGRKSTVLQWCILLHRNLPSYFIIQNFSLTCINWLAISMLTAANFLYQVSKISWTGSAWNYKWTPKYPVLIVFPFSLNFSLVYFSSYHITQQNSLHFEID